MSDSGKLLLTGVACLAIGAIAGNFLPTGTSSADGIDKNEVEAIVANYISSNPEKIVESLQGMQAKAAAEQQAKTAGALKNHLSTIMDDTNAPTAGTGKSGIVIAEFFDYRCGYCKRMANTVQQLLEKHPDIKVVFKEFPILSEGSRKAAMASLAINYLKPERYMDYHMMLMKHQGDYTDSALKDYAGQVQVDIAAFEKEMNGQRVAKELQAVADVANKTGIQGTPALVLDGELIPGAIPFADVEARIAALKAKKS